MASTEVVELKAGLTIRSLLITIIFVAIYAPLSAVIGLYTNKTGTFGSFIIPMVYIAVIAELLGRVSPKLRIAPQEYVFIFSVICFLGLHSHLTMHAAAHSNLMSMPTWSVFEPYLGLAQSALQKIWSNALGNSWAVAPEPYRFDIAKMIASGRVAGEAIPWNYLIPAFIYWGLAFLFYSFISMFIAFTFGKPWIEEERLVFPLALPSLYLFREAGEIDPSTNKSRILDFKNTATKVFWGMFLIGAISGINPLIAELWPEFPIASWWGETKLNMEFLAGTGIYASGIFFIPQIAVGLVLPNDVLISFILGWVIFGVIYQYIAIQAGWVAYYSGMEFEWPWSGNYPGRVMPFPYRFFAMNGMAIGIGLWALYRQRKRVMNVISALWKGGEERGISLRIVSLLLFIGIFGWYALMVADGADPIVAIELPILAFIFNIFYARVYAETFWQVGCGMGFAQGPSIWELMYQTGVVTRGWPTEVSWGSPMTDRSWFIINMNYSAVASWNTSFSMMSGGSMVTLYKLAYDLKMKMRDFLIALIVGTLVLLFVLLPLVCYFILSTQGGYSAFTHLNSWWCWTMSGYYITGRSSVTGLDVGYNLGVLIGLGAVVSIVLYLLKTYVPFLWFINVPALYTSMIQANYMWLTSLIALIIKYVAIRTIGVKRYEEYAMPIVAGWILGFGAMWLPAALINLFGVAIPRMQSLWVP